MKLHAAEVSFAYGRREMLRGLDCAFPEGRMTAIVGASASGKSTLLRAMARLVKPQAGAVLLDGADACGPPLRRVVQANHEAVDGLPW